MEPYVRRPNPLTWVLAVVAMVAATVLVVVHWTAGESASQRGWEPAIVIALGSAGVLACLLEARRLSGMDRIER
jgi:hypothetical protein